MTNRDILKIALQQSAFDANCDSDDFLQSNAVIVPSVQNEHARRYLQLPFPCHLISYGNNVVASIDEAYRDIVTSYLAAYAPEHCFETPNLHVLNDAFRPQGMQVCFMAEYFLPDAEKIPTIDCKYEIQILEQADFAGLYLPQWSNALCKERKQLDVLGAGAYKDGRLVGLAACSADCEEMWQIGIDVLPQERRQGIASALTSRLAKEILARGKVPFYCCAWSNMRSARNAIKSGFRPAWVELTVKPNEVINRLNQK